MLSRENLKTSIKYKGQRTRNNVVSENPSKSFKSLIKNIDIMGKVFIKVQQQYFKPEDKQVYFTKTVTYTKIGFDQLVEHIAKD